MTETSVPQPNEDRYITENFGNCSFAYGKDRTQYVQPFVTCTSGIETFSLIPQEDGKWTIVVSVGDEMERPDEEGRSSILEVTIKVDDSDAHNLSMLWPGHWGMALKSLEFSEIAPLLDELRRGGAVTVTRNKEEIEFDLERANSAFVELVFEQLIALSKVEPDDRQ